MPTGQRNRLTNMDGTLKNNMVRGAQVAMNQGLSSQTTYPTGRGGAAQCSNQGDCTPAADR